ncbi:hypothetical protein R5R35_011911 [Gryllus longicercus]|uniref:RING-type E3 ubiquitin transferase n=1 Tax=Gryllus longicercus TaxID=2509291 RepID=A0AAN9W1F3_9ORTH
MRSPIVLCESGHSICQNCREKVEVCPICKGEYPGIRNRLAEDIATHIALQRCKNDNRGCQELVPTNELDVHEADCPYRLYLCRMCKGRVIFHEMSDHFEKLHPENVMKNGVPRRVTIREVRPDCSYTYQIDAYERLFWFWRKNAGDLVHLGVQLVGNPRNHTHFFYRLEITSPDRETQVVFNAPVHSENERGPALITSSKCAVVSAELLDQGAIYSVFISQYENLEPVENSESNL